MICHTCAKPNCVDDCTNFLPPALKVGSAEHKLQELLKITNDLTSVSYKYDLDREESRCVFCDYHNPDYSNGIPAPYIGHSSLCPILELEQFKATL